jgi:hypothetical protein
MLLSQGTMPQNLRAIVGRRKLGNIRLLPRSIVLFPASVAWPVNSPRDREAREKQIAMIA